MKKRLLSVLLCCVLLVGLLPTAALAEENDAVSVTINGATTTYPTFAEAINAVNSSSEGDTVTLELLQDVNLTETLTISKNVTIFSNQTSPKMISSTTDQHSYLLRLTADVTLQNVIVDGGSTSGMTAVRALIAVDDGTNPGHLTLKDGAILQNNNNTTENGAGGAVCVLKGSSFTMNGGQITGNTAYQGGGIAVMDTSCAVQIAGGTISGNRATTENKTGGGGIYAYAGTVTMSGGQITNNSAALYGGGIYIYGAADKQPATFRLQDGSITKNNAQYGGGVFVNVAESAELSGGAVTGNTASGWAGGVMIAPDSKLTLSGDIQVTGNNNESNEPGKDLYLDGYKDNETIIHFPSVTLGALSGAQLDIYTWLKPEEGGTLELAAPAEGGSISDEALDCLRYEDAGYARWVSNDGKLVLSAKASAPQIRNRIQLGASDINGWSAEGGYDYIYLGEWEDDPVKWRVLSANGDGASYYYNFNTDKKYGDSALFLLSEDVFDSVQYNTSNRNKWTGSAALNWCTNFVNNRFAPTESRAILETYLKKDTAGIYNGTAYTATNQVTNAAKVFFLYASEATKEAYGLGTAEARKASADWWLITAAKDRVSSKYLVGAINKDTGEVTPTIATERKSARPALNLDKNQVLFTSAADNSAHKDFSSAHGSYTGHAFKLTLKDQNSFAEGAKIVGGRTIWNNAYTNAAITIQHKALQDISGTYTNVTATLTASNGDLLYYGSVNPDETAASTTVTLPKGLADGTYTLCLYGEDWNDPNESDFATGTPFTVEITIHDGEDGPDLTPREQPGLMSIDDLSGYDVQWGYNYLYFGNYSGEPILWRVLSTSGNATGDTDSLKQGDTTVSNEAAMFLLSEYLLGEGTNGGVQYYAAANGINDYIGSLAQAWCRTATSSDSPYKAFTTGELSAILDTTKSDPEYAGTNWRGKVYKAADNILDNDKVFFLSAEEAANASYGFATENQLIAYYNNTATRWWLRSAIKDENADSAGAVSYSSTYGWELCPEKVTEHTPARPAFNLSKNAVLFITTANGVKSGTADAALNEIGSNISSEWKLTLRDDSREFSVTEEDAEASSGGTLTLHYTGAQTGENEYISAIFYDADGKPAYYGMLKALNSEDAAAGSVELTVPTGLTEEPYQIVLFNEQYNGANQTDYASRLCAVTLTVDNTAPELSDFAVSRASASTATVDFTADEQGTYYYVVNDSEAAPSMDTDGVGTKMVKGRQTLELSDVSSGKSYLHIVAKDAAGNVCDVQTIPILGFLPAPTNADWEDATLGKASWGAVEHASGYRVQLYKDGVAFGSAVTVTETNDTFPIPEPPEESTDGTTSSPTLPDNAITEAGTYSFRVTALGDNEEYSNSIAAESARHLSSITVEENETGTVTASARYAVTGTEITLTAKPNSGYRFSKWSLTPELTVTDNKFIMPDEAVTVRAAFSWRSSGGSSASTYPITVKDSENGRAASSRDRAGAGEIVTITVTPDKGYTLETITVTDKNGKALKLTDQGGGRYTFTMPASGVTVTATFMDDNTMLNFFVDVKASDYFYDAVLWAAQNDITTGTDAVHFSPNQPCTRAQIVTFLWRAAGSPVVDYAMNMTDVPGDAYYAEAVRWALREGVTTGTTKTTFSPDETCTRAQAVTFLCRSQKAAAEGGMAVREFTDFSSIPAYAVDAIQWALENHVTTGAGDGSFVPNAACTRAQIVTFLYRLHLSRQDAGR